MLSSLAPARRRVVLGAVSLVAVLILAVTALVVVDHVAGSSDRTGAAVAPVAAGGSGVVLLVPGYGGSTSSLDELAAFLRSRGKQVEIVRLLGDGKGDLDAQARLLAADVQALHTSSVDVVGYSAGGVVARLWLRYYGGAALARRVITLGSPHHGTDVAGIAGNIAPNQCPSACRELESGSQLLNALNRGDETPPGPAYVSIWTDHDDVVLPASSAHLQGALNVILQSVCRSDHVAHSGLPHDPAVLSIVAAELGSGPILRPSSDVCR